MENCDDTNCGSDDVDDKKKYLSKSRKSTYLTNFKKLDLVKVKKSDFVKVHSF